MIMTVLNDGASIVSNGGHPAWRSAGIDLDYDVPTIYLLFHNLVGERRLNFLKGGGVAPLALEA